MSDVEEALNFVDCSYIAADNSVIFPEANQKLQRTIKTALQERAEREKGCEGCKVYAALQRYHRSQEQCPDCRGCIRVAIDRYQAEK